LKIVYTPKCLRFGRIGHPESPRRVEKAADFLKNKGYEFTDPGKCTEEDLLTVHSRDFIEKVKNNNFHISDCPRYDKIYEYACLSVGGALKAAEINGFSLMRPPGHHATHDSVGGFCYFNNIAVAVERSDKKVLIVDIDRHHGNGTQNIFFGRDDVEYVSLHSVGYPGTGKLSKQNCRNHRFTRTVEDDEYLEVLGSMLNSSGEFDLLAVSAGFDTHKEDPLASQIQLTTESYRRVGKKLSELGLPTFCVLEGGYGADHLGKNIHSFISGLED